MKVGIRKNPTEPVASNFLACRSNQDFVAANKKEKGMTIKSKVRRQSFVWQKPKYCCCDREEQA